jgi:hypothetical protein
VFLIVVFLLGLVLIPPIVAVTGEDVFETIYQLFSTIWNQPWRLVIYESLLLFVKALGTVIFAAVSIAGMFVAFLPSTIMASQESHYLANVISRSLRITGMDSLAQLIPRSLEAVGMGPVADLVPNAQSAVSMPWTLDVATFFLFASLIMVAAIVLSYPLSMISSGYTILYVVLRKKTTDENLLDVEEEEEMRPDVEEKAEEETEEAEEESEEK